MGPSQDFVAVEEMDANRSSVPRSNHDGNEDGTRKDTSSAHAIAVTEEDLEDEIRREITAQIAQAELVGNGENQEKDNGNDKSQKRNYMLLGGLVLMVAVAVIVGVVLGTNSNSESPEILLRGGEGETSYPSAAPTTSSAPTLEPSGWIYVVSTERLDYCTHNRKGKNCDSQTMLACARHGHHAHS